MFRRMTRERYLSDAELARFMAAVRTRSHVNQPRDYALFALLANTGLRPAEARALRRRDLHLEGREPWIELHRPRKKHGPEQLPALILNRAVAAVIRSYLATIGENPDLLVFPVSKRQSARLFHYYANKAGVDGRRVYSLRHTAGMRLWRFTGDARLVQAVLGHTNQSATACYFHTGDDAIRSAYDSAGVVA